jgi:hypothetical protein
VKYRLQGSLYRLREVQGSHLKELLGGKVQGLPTVPLILHELLGKVKGSLCCYILHKFKVTNKQNCYFSQPFSFFSTWPVYCTMNEPRPVQIKKINVCEHFGR